MTFFLAVVARGWGISAFRWSICAEVFFTSTVITGAFGNVAVKVTVVVSVIPEVGFSSGFSIRSLGRLTFVW